MNNNDMYSMQKVNEPRRRYKASTFALGLLSLVGAFGVDLALNPNMFAQASSSTNTTPTSNTTGTGTGTGTTPAAAKSATSDALQYMYGTVQVKVTKAAGKITAIDLVQAQATNGREQAFSVLVDAAIKANGSNFGNLSGATYTTDVFKQAVDSALSKLG